MRVAVMQPCFIPYAGYFRLFAACDLFVILDDVQLNRRGWVHRNKLKRKDGMQEWITLPLKKSPRDETTIMGMEWAADAASIWNDQISRFPVFSETRPYNTTLLLALWASTFASPLKVITETLGSACQVLGTVRPMVYSHDLAIDPGLHGQDRILSICQKAGAKVYVNAPGGKDLYDPVAFARRGIRLEILPDYDGPATSILERLSYENPEEIKKEIMENL